jgi:hypothetical protein
LRKYMKKLLLAISVIAFTSCQDCNNVCTDTITRKVYVDGIEVYRETLYRPVVHDCESYDFRDQWRDKQGRKVIDYHNIRCQND